MKTYIVQLEPHDDAISARDKISWSKARRVLLIWPRRGKILSRRVDLLLLQRHSQQLGAQIAIVTRSSDVKAHAENLGIAVFDSAVKAQASSWHRARKRKSPGLETAADGRAAWAERLAAVRPVGSRAQLREQRDVLHARQPENHWLRLSAFGIGVLAFLILALCFVPGARVELKPKH